MSNPDRLTAIKAGLELLKGEELSFHQMREVRRRIEREYLPWAVSRLEQLQEEFDLALLQMKEDSERIATRDEVLKQERARLEQFQEDVQRAANFLFNSTPITDKELFGLLQAALDRSKDSAALAQTAGKGEPSTTHLSQAEIDELNDCEG